MVTLQAGEAEEQLSAAAAQAIPQSPMAAAAEVHEWSASEWQAWAERREHAWQRWSDEQWRQQQWWQQYPPSMELRSAREVSDPPAWPGWEHFRLWRRAVQRWDRNTDLPPSRRAARLLGKLDWPLQAKLEHIPEETLSTEKYLESILKVLNAA